MPNRFILIRHGSTDWNIAKRYQGQTDIPLNNEGRKQAKELAKMLQKVPIDLIYTSDLSRAYETAEIIAEGRNIPIHRLKSFRETHFGHWEGLTVDEIHGNYPEDVERLKKDPIHGKRPGGESRGMMLERVNKAIHKIMHDHPDESIAIVGHQGSLSAAVCAITGENFEEGRKKYRLENTAYHVLEKEHGKWHMRHIGKKAEWMIKT